MIPTMTRTALPLAALAALALAACGEDPEKAVQRGTARRTACVAEELAIRANTNLAALDTLRGGPTSGAMGAIYSYQTAYFNYAKLRERQAASSDSAAAAATPEDSARHATKAAQSTPPRGQPGTVQANASATYERDFSAALGNPDHPCNEEEVR